MNNYIIRQLTKDDYEKYYILINDFQETYFLKDDFNKMLDKIKNNIEIWIIEYNNQLLATGTILYEYKFIHNISLYAHIEDICVKKNYRKEGIGIILMDHLVKRSKELGCYKITLDCKENLEYFYNKSGFKKNGLQMIIYL
jgi:glucosamine-phosphate N-acetyltransferase